MSADDVRKLLLKRAAEYRTHRGFGLRGWCAEHGVSPTHASEFLNGKRGPTSNLLEALGLEWRITRKVTRPHAAGERPHD